VLIVIFKRRNVPLFDRAIVSPRAVIVEKDPGPAAPESGPVKWGR
jgi:hypothetical protein